MRFCEEEVKEFMLKSEQLGVSALRNEILTYCVDNYDEIFTAKQIIDLIEVLQTKAFNQLLIDRIECGMELSIF